jgi:uncharacterized membrane protein
MPADKNIIMEQSIPASLEELKQKRKLILANVESEQGKDSFMGTLALWITDHVGTMGFFLIIFIWTCVWLSWNIFAPKQVRFDPYPGFVLWLFISNMIQLFLMPLIMLGQNIQAKHADIRAEADLKINIQAALENEAILYHLEYQNEMIIKKP